MGCDICEGLNISCPNGCERGELITPEDTPEDFAEKFASSLESQANEMSEAMEAFSGYPDVVAGFMCSASWLRRTAKAIRDMPL